MYGWILLFARFFIFQITNYARNYIHLLCFLFRIFILLHGFIAIFLVRYSFDCCAVRTKRRGGGEWSKEGESSHNLHKSPLLSHSLPLYFSHFAHIFYAILLLHHNSYTMPECIYFVCVFLSLPLFILIFFSYHSVSVFQFMHLAIFALALVLTLLILAVWVSISLLFFFSLPLFVRYRKIMHK